MASKEHRWLHWMQHQVDDAPVGKLSAKVLARMYPAMSAWARRRSEKGAQKAEALLERYIAELEAGNPHTSPTVSHFNTVVSAWAKSRKRSAPEQAQRIVRRMQELRKKHTLTDIAPDVVTLSTLLAAWSASRKPEAVQKVVKLLEFMEMAGHDVTTTTYNSAIRVLVHSPATDKALQVEDILNRMLDRHENQGMSCKPDIYTYQSLIVAWSRTRVGGTPQKAEELLQSPTEKSALPGQERLTPNSHCYTAAIHAWAYSNEQNKARRAYQILLRMRERWAETRSDDMRPNIVAYTAVINACSNPHHDSESETSLQIAKLIMEEIRYFDCGKPNFVTYAAFFKVIGSTMEEGSPEREALVRRTFENCCREGQVGRLVIDKVKQAASKELFEELIPLKGIPFEWNCNVQGEHNETTESSEEEDDEQQPAGSTTLTDESMAKLRAVREKSGVAGPFSRESADDDMPNVSWSYGSL